MQNELAARIQRMEDVHEITNLQALYSFHIDSDEIDDLVELFVDDFTWHVGFEQMKKITSKPKLAEFLTESSHKTPMMRHQPITPYIRVDGDRATGIWYLTGMITSVTPKGDEARWVQGRYDNEYVRANGSWKFSRLYFKYNFLTPYEDGWVKTPMAPFLA